MATLNYGPMVTDMRRVFATDRTKAKSWREGQLKAIIRFLTEEKATICNALKRDLNKDEYDSMTDEIAYCVNEATWFLENIASLMKDKKKPVSVFNLGGSAYVHYEPLGVVLDIGAWNYPIQIPISTMINIIAAGNCVVIKPSEISAHTANLLADLIPRYMDNDCVKVVTGAVAETTALLKVKWDHVIYTGSGPVGRIVYKAAAEHLTPVTLELGGKCPGYVSAGSDLESVCNRLTWTKFKNAGQTCISVDYVLVDESVEEAFINQMIAAVQEQYSLNPATSDSYGRIVSDRHFQRLTELIESSPHARVRLGGVTNRAEKYISPTILTGITGQDRMMQEEIFGPILPVLTVRNHEEAIEFINARDKALHVNVFTKQKRIIDEFVSRTSSGGFSANDAMLFRVERGLPFGGVGASGSGSYGGDCGFANFSHKKSVLLKPQGMEFLFRLMRYAPHTESKMQWLQFMQKAPKTAGRVCKGLAILIPIAVLIGVAIYFGVNKDELLSKPEL